MKHPARWIALGREAPAFSLPTLTGQKVTHPTTSRSRPQSSVNFWNTWSIPCEKEPPALEAFYQAHANSPDFAMAGIVRDAQKRKSGIADYVRTQGMGWTIALDPESTAALDFAARGQPETFAITPDGQIVGFQLAEVTKGNLETMLGAARGEQ